MKTSSSNTAYYSDKDQNKNDPSNAEKISSEFRNFLADIEDLVKASSSVTGDELVQVREKINTTITAAKTSLEDTGENIYAKAKKNVKVVDNYAHKKPWQVIAASTLIGCFLGALLARRS